MVKTGLTDEFRGARCNAAIWRYCVVTHVNLCFALLENKLDLIHLTSQARTYPGAQRPMKILRTNIVAAVILVGFWPFPSLAVEPEKPVKIRCDELQKKAEDNTLSPKEAELWLSCNPLTPWPLDDLPRGLNASHPPPALQQSPSGFFPTFNSEEQS